MGESLERFIALKDNIRLFSKFSQTQLNLSKIFLQGVNRKGEINRTVIIRLK